MILDTLDHRMQYASLGKSLADALDFLASQDFSSVAPGRIDLRGEALYALVQQYTTRPATQGAWEAHRRYIDIQYLVLGEERIFFSPLDRMQTQDYIPEKDFVPMTGRGMLLDLSAGTFVVFFPQDAHMPGLAVDMPVAVKKVVVKIRID
jgi:YhcH/YjgK/YiaL family protein